MKRILMALAVLLAVQVADAQVKTPEAVKKALASAETASKDAKKATKVATWLNLANSYMDAYNAHRVLRGLELVRLSFSLLWVMRSLFPLKA